eukprot:233653_1
METVIFLLTILVTITTTSISIRSIGKWPRWGSNLQNQQRAIFASPSFTKNRLKESTSTKCVYDFNDTATIPQRGEIGSAYVIIDDNNNAVLTTKTGYIFKIDLISCELIWKRNISELIGINKPIYGVDSVTLYQLSDADNEFDNYNKYSILFGTTGADMQFIDGVFDGSTDNDCYAVSVSSNGTLEWFINLGVEHYLHAGCLIHGFIIDDIYAYGGMSSFGWGISYKDQGFRGKMMKINLLNQTIENEWYAFPEEKSGKANESSYTGTGIWGWPAIIDEYIIFGTGQMLSAPDYIDDCFRNESNIKFDRFTENICGENVENETLYWKCMEANVYPSSMIVLNKNTFQVKISAVLNGMDVWKGGCNPAEFTLLNNTECPAFPGTDGDLSALSSYYDKDTGRIYAAGLSKTGMFYVYDIESAELKISKKVGPWSEIGGGTWSLAIDTDSMMAFATITGGAVRSGYKIYRETLADGNIVCETGTLHAIDLKTGYTLYQIVDSYGYLNNNSFCYSESFNSYVDVTIDGVCERAFNGSEMLSASETANNKVYYPIKTEPIPTETLARFHGGVTIVNDMIIIASVSGDAYIHDLKTGEYIDSVTCANHEFVSDNVTYSYRSSLYSGVSVYDNKLVMFCTGLNGLFSSELVSIKFNLTIDDKGLEIEEIIGIIIGCIVAVAVIGLCLRYIYRKRTNGSVYNKIGLTTYDERI